MKSAHTTATRKWPMSHGIATYNFTAAPPELSMLRNHISTLENRIEQQAALIATLAEKASHDSLTSLLNRQGMEAVLNDAINNYHRYGHQGALLMLDLNGFKDINDTYGHAAGDAILKHVAHGLARSTRDTDSICRLGGDEFMVYLVEANLANALVMARRMRSWLAENPLVWDGEVLTVGISVGIATMSEAPSMPQLVELADSRMYRFKQALKRISAQ